MKGIALPVRIPRQRLIRCIKMADDSFDVRSPKGVMEFESECHDVPMLTVGKIKLSAAHVDEILAAAATQFTRHHQGERVYILDGKIAAIDASYDDPNCPENQQINIAYDRSISHFYEAHVVFRISIDQPPDPFEEEYDPFGDSGY